MPDINDYAIGCSRLLRTDKVVVNAADGIANDGSRIITGKYLDLGEVINAPNLNAGSSFYGSWLDDLTWVRNYMVSVTSDQPYDVIVQRRDTSYMADWGITLTSKTPATSAVNSYRPHNFHGANGLLGYSVRFIFRNSGTDTNTYAKVRVQLMGM